MFFCQYLELSSKTVFNKKNTEITESVRRIFRNEYNKGLYADGIIFGEVVKYEGDPRSNANPFVISSVISISKNV